LNLIIIPIVLVRRLLIPLACLGALASMAVPGWAQTAPRPEIVATTPVLGSILRDVVGDEARVTVVMPNGADPHEFQPSARDVGGLATADLVVANGRGLEEGLKDPLRQAEQDGTPVVDATDLVTLRRFDPSARDEIAEHGPDDPHIWTDPLTMRQLVAGLVPVLREEAGIDVAARAAKLQDRLTDLDAQIRATLADVPPGRRTLVTGHESMGYFADRYGFALVGALVPSLSSQAQVSASSLSALRDQVRAEGVPAIFNEIGTPDGVAAAIADETGARVVDVPTHTLPGDGSYFTFMREIAAAVADGLGGPAAR
jgi:zinc/manganese transport system substrate-binding protein